MAILIVDNKREQVSDLCEILNEEGYDAEIISYSQLAKKYLLGVELVIMDVMEDQLIDGYEWSDMPYLGLHMAGRILEPNAITYIFYTNLDNPKKFPVLNYKRDFCRGLYYKSTYPPTLILREIECLLSGTRNE